MMNALWQVRVRVSFADGDESVQMVSLSSPDLKDTKKAKRRASETAKERLRRKTIAIFGAKARGAKFASIDVQCVG